MNNKIIDLLADRRIINENIIRLVNEDTKAYHTRKTISVLTSKQKRCFGYMIFVLHF